MFENKKTVMTLILLVFCIVGEGIVLHDAFEQKQLVDHGTVTTASVVEEKRCHVGSARRKSLKRRYEVRYTIGESSYQACLYDIHAPRIETEPIFSVSIGSGEQPPAREPLESVEIIVDPLDPEPRYVYSTSYLETWKSRVVWKTLIAVGFGLFGMFVIRKGKVVHKN